MHAWRLLAAIGVVALGGCTSVYNLPHNQPLTGTVQALPLGSEVPLSSDDVMISLVGANWRCNDVNVFVERVGFDQFDRARADALNAIPTRFHLPQASVDLLIEAGGEAVRNNLIYQAFRRGL